MAVGSLRRRGMAIQGLQHTEPTPSLLQLGAAVGLLGTGGAA
eukprot:COSAG01_NODE_57977_length_309_cov_0.523810_1_plen_41_part_01